MRTNNGKAKNVIISLYFILVVLTILAVTLVGSFSDLYNSKLIAVLTILVIFAVLFLLTHRISRYFEYDSDGLKVVVMNKGLLLSEYFNYREHRVEFSKEELKGYKLRDYLFYKSLTLYLEGRQSTKKETFNVTLVSRKKLKYIKQSLSKTVRHNRKLKERQQNE